ncbi:Acetyltransferase [Rubrivivax sp. A210]|uniref:GNAT family N-acetyltransferase n=1 Tax=Rubrivivax sp. A210 TaxID=2772301 RepID=UPI00191B8664|nr:Acetyltransferase [Rubrivivax sp. A210]
MASSTRQFQPEHYSSALDLWRKTPGVGLSAADERSEIERFLNRNPGLSFVATGDREEVIGTILCGHDGRRGLIHHLVVDTSHRRAGLATALLNSSRRELAALGIEKAHLLVFKSNVGGHAFWRKVAAERTEMGLFSVSTSDA